jgi:hypothetical protein
MMCISRYLLGICHGPNARCGQFSLGQATQEIEASREMSQSQLFMCPLSLYSPPWTHLCFLLAVDRSVSLILSVQSREGNTYLTVFS